MRRKEATHWCNNPHTRITLDLIFTVQTNMGFLKILTYTHTDWVTSVRNHINEISLCSLKRNFTGDNKNTNNTGEHQLYSIKFYHMANVFGFVANSDKHSFIYINVQL